MFGFRFSEGYSDATIGSMVIEYTTVNINSLNNL